MESNQARPVWRTGAAIALIAIPLSLVAARIFLGPHWLADASLAALPKHARKHAEYLFFVPLSAGVVAFFRFTLGVKVLSLFRPALIAIAFQRTGIPLGLAFLTLALATVAALQPPLKGRHYYERTTLIAVIVVAMMVCSLIAFQHWHSRWMLHLAYFPVIALCLTCESFASALAKAGAAEALWRAITTTAVGIVVLAIDRVPGLIPALVRCPELLIAEAGFVVLIAERFDYRIFQGFNPLQRLSNEEPAIEFRINEAELLETGK